MSAPCIRDSVLFGAALCQVITYSSVVLDGRARGAQQTRIDGRTVVLVPYTAGLVSVVHTWMQKVELF